MPGIASPATACWGAFHDQLGKSISSPALVADASAFASGPKFCAFDTAKAGLAAEVGREPGTAGVAGRDPPPLRDEGRCPNPPNEEPMAARGVKGWLSVLSRSAFFDSMVRQELGLTPGDCLVSPGWAANKVGKEGEGKEGEGRGQRGKGN